MNRRVIVKPLSLFASALFVAAAPLLSSACGEGEKDEAEEHAELCKACEGDDAKLGACQEKLEDCEASSEEGTEEHEECEDAANDDCE